MIDYSEQKSEAHLRSDCRLCRRWAT